MIAPLFQDEEELKRYFSRRTYKSSIVKVNRLNEEEWICLLGDAAHSVVPSFGEGINSGLEDSMILQECMASKNPFHKFNSRRLIDTSALFEYAKYLNAVPKFSGERISRAIFSILNSLFN